MDLDVTPHHSHHLARLPPSTSPPPLGERTRQFKRTHSHFDSNTMGDHEHEISDISDLPHHVWEDEPPSTYGTPIGSGPHLVGLSHEYFYFLSHCGFGRDTLSFSSFSRASSFHVSSSFGRENQTFQEELFSL